MGIDARAIGCIARANRLHDALCLGLKNLPGASDLITRKSLIPNEMLRQVSARGGARERTRGAGVQTRSRAKPVTTRDSGRRLYHPHSHECRAQRGYSHPS
jgi:hypothetical protein